MSRTDSITLWKDRITSRRLSGMKVNDWCEQNGISRHAYYYWHRKLQDMQAEQENIFTEVQVSPAPETADVKKTTNSGLMISWKDFSVCITEPGAVPMAADLLSRLANQC